MGYVVIKAKAPSTFYIIAKNYKPQSLDWGPAGIAHTKSNSLCFSFYHSPLTFQLLMINSLKIHIFAFPSRGEKS